MRISDWSSDVCSSDLHVVWSDAALDSATVRRLHALLDYGGPVVDAAKAAADELILRVVPRFGTVSPWASKATDIAHNCGLALVRRVERGVRYVLTVDTGLMEIGRAHV